MDAFFPTTDPVLIVAIAMLFFLLAPPLSERARLPGIIGLILAGALVGPAGLGLLERDATIELLGTVGLLYLMFLAGLELDLLGFVRHRNRSLTFGALSFFLPFGLALATMGFLGFSLPAVLLIGAIVASHTLLAYPVAGRLGITKDTAVGAVVGGTLLTDSLSLSVLLIIDAAASGEQGLWFWLRLAGSLAVYLAAVSFALPRLGRWFFKNVGSESTSRFFFLMSGLFVSAFLADLAGAQPIIGAFLAGLMLNRLVPDQSPLMTRVRFFGSAFFIPFFLFSVGMLVDFTALFSSTRVAIITAALIALVLVGKGGAALLSARILGLDGTRGWLMAGLSIPQAAATLAVTFVGVEIGLFDDTVVSAVVVLVLVSCLIGASLVERAGRAVALSIERAPQAPDEAPRRILVPLVNPATAEALLDTAFLIREPNSTEPVFPLTVVDDDDQVSSRVAGAERMLAHAVVHAAEADVPANPMTRVAQNPAVGITRAASERRTTDIIIGWAGRRTAVPRVIFGNVIDQTLQLTEQQILVCKLARPINTYRRLVMVLPPMIDYGLGFYRAVRTIEALRTKLGLDLLVRTVTRDENDAASERISRRFDDMKLHVPTKIVDVPGWRALLRSLQEDLVPTDLIIVPSARRGTVAHSFHLERLPTDLTVLGADFVIVYPSEQPTSGQPQHRMRRLPPLLTEERVVFDLGDVPYPEAVERLLASTFPQRNERSAVARALLREDAEHAAEVLPGILIFHARVAASREPMLFLGMSRHGIRHPRSPGPAHVVTVLLSPADAAPQEHLARLSEVVEQLASGGRTRDLVRSSDMEDLRAWFAGDEAARS